MSTAVEAAVSLACHPDTPCEDIRAIDVVVRRTRAELQLIFHLDGRLSRIRLPPVGAPELWRHTCVELFVGIDGRLAYHEFNFSPSGEWRAFGFHSYRDALRSQSQVRSPLVTVNGTKDTIGLNARIALADLSEVHPFSPLRIGLASVIELSDGSFCYWALRHRPGKPDFHHADGFALRLEVPSLE